MSLLYGEYLGEREERKGEETWGSSDTEILPNPLPKPLAWGGKKERGRTSPKEEKGAQQGQLVIRVLRIPRDGGERKGEKDAQRGQAGLAPSRPPAVNVDPELSEERKEKKRRKKRRG